MKPYKCFLIKSVVQGRLQTFTVRVDNRDAHWLRSHVWKVREVGGYLEVYGYPDGHTMTQLGRAILGEKRKGYQVQYIDHDGLNCRRENLCARSPDEYMAKVRSCRVEKSTP